MRIKERDKSIDLEPSSPGNIQQKIKKMFDGAVQPARNTEALSQTKWKSQDRKASVTLRDQDSFSSAPQLPTFNTTAISENELGSIRWQTPIEMPLHSLEYACPFY